MSGRRLQSFRLLLAATAFASATPAFADAIDGHWCSEEGRRISIAGPDVTTTTGVTSKGNYSRHHFNFTMPTAETDAGAAVTMVLQGEQRVQVKIGAGDTKIWRRCPPGVS